MDASIVVCTYNRAESLKETLAVLACLEAPQARTWEALFVHNNSLDHTKHVVEAVQQNWPRLRYVFEHAQGLSHARNRGITEAGGEVILFFAPRPRMTPPPLFSCCRPAGAPARP